MENWIVKIDEFERIEEGYHMKGFFIGVNFAAKPYHMESFDVIFDEALEKIVHTTAMRGDELNHSPRLLLEERIYKHRLSVQLGETIIKE